MNYGHPDGWKETDMIHVFDADAVEDILGISDEDHIVCFGHDYDDYGHVSVEDATFIVQAVNAHDALVSALKDFIEEWDYLAMNQLAPCYEKACAALAESAGKGE